MKSPSLHNAVYLIVRRHIFVAVCWFGMDDPLQLSLRYQCSLIIKLVVRVKKAVGS